MLSDAVSNALSKLEKDRKFFSGMSNFPIKIFDDAIHDLNSIEQVEKNKVKISKVFLSPYYELSKLKKIQKIKCVIDSVQLIIDFKLINQCTYFLICKSFRNLLFFSQTSKSVHLKMIEFFDVLIDDKNIQLSTNITQIFFPLLIKLYARDPSIRNEISRFISKYTSTIFKFLDDFFRPLLIKKKNELQSHENLDSVENLSRGSNGDVVMDNEGNFSQRKKQSFYTITESLSQSENDNSGNYVNPVNNTNNNNQLFEKVTEPISASGALIRNIDISDFKNFDIYKISVYIFGYYLNVLITKVEKPTTLSKKFSIDQISLIITQTKTLFLYIDDYINIIASDLANVLCTLLQRETDIELKSKILNLVSIISNQFHIAYWLFPLFIKDITETSFGTYEAYMCYELLNNLTANENLINDLYRLKSDQWNAMYNMRRNYKNCNYMKSLADTLVPLENFLSGFYDDISVSIIDKILSLLDEKRLVLIKRVKIIDTKISSEMKSKKITFKSRIFRNDYIAIFIQIAKNFQSIIMSALTAQHIFVDTINGPINDEQSTNETKKLKQMIIYYSTFILNTLKFLITENEKEEIRTLINMCIFYMKVLSIFNCDCLKKEFGDLILIAIQSKDYLKINDIAYIAKEFFIFVTNIKLNNTIESWLIILDIMNNLNDKMIQFNSSFIIIPEPKTEIEIYIKHIEHFMRMYSFNFFDTILTDDNQNANMTCQEDSCIETQKQESSLEIPKSNSVKNIKNKKLLCYDLLYETNPSTGPSLSKFKSVVNLNSDAKTTIINDTDTQQKFGININSEENNSENLSSNKSDIFVEEDGNLKEDQFDFPHVKSFQKGENYSLIISNLLDSFFIEHSPNYDDKYIYQIILNALVKSTLRANRAKNISQIKFNLLKILEISSVNTSRINIAWDKITLILYEVYTLIDDCAVQIFCFDVLTMISMFTLSLYEEQETPNDAWSREKYQIILFENLQKFISVCRPESVLYLIDDIRCLIKHCSKKINSSGWKKFIDILYTIYTKCDSDILWHSTCLLDEIQEKWEEIILTQTSILTLMNIFKLYILKGDIKVKEYIIDLIMRLFKDDDKVDPREVLAELFLDDFFETRTKAIQAYKEMSLKKYESKEAMIELKIAEIYKHYKNEVLKRGIVKCDECERRKKEQDFLEKELINSKNYGRKFDCGFRKFRFVSLIEESQYCETKLRCASTHLNSKNCRKISKSKREKEWEKTLISTISLIEICFSSINEKIFKDLYLVSSFASSEVLSTVLLTLVHFIKKDKEYQDDEEDDEEANPLDGKIIENIEPLFHQILVTASLESFKLNFPLLSQEENDNFINLLITIPEIFYQRGMSIKRLDDFLKKILKASTVPDCSLNSLTPSEEKIFEFCSLLPSLYHTSLVNFYISTLSINLTNMHSILISEKSLQQCQEIITPEYILSIDKKLMAEIMRKMIQKFQVNWILFSTNIFQNKYDFFFNNGFDVQNNNQVCEFYFIKTISILSLFIEAVQDNNLYFLVNSFIEYLLENENSILKEKLIDYCSSRYLLLTDSFYPIFGNNLGKLLIKNVSFSSPVNLFQLLISNLFDEEIQCPLSRKISFKYMTEEVINKYINEEKRNEMPIQQIKINNMLIALNSLNALVENSDKNDSIEEFSCYLPYLSKLKSTKELRISTLCEALLKNLNKKNKKNEKR